MSINKKDGISENKLEDSFSKWVKFLNSFPQSSVFLNQNYSYWELCTVVDVLHDGSSYNRLQVAGGYIITVKMCAK